MKFLQLSATDPEAAPSESFSKETEFMILVGWDALRQSKPVTQWCQLDPSISMVPGFVGHYIGEMCLNTSSRLGDFDHYRPGPERITKYPNEELYHESS